MGRLAALAGLVVFLGTGALARAAEPPLETLVAALGPARAEPGAEVIDLAGEWAFALGGSEPAFPQAGEPAGLRFTETITLPGTTETRGKGPLNEARETGQLTRVRKYDGPAWYRRVIEVPAEWAGRDLTLFLERTKYAQVWFDGAACGAQRWGTVPHRTLLAKAVAPGLHTLTVMVDNRPERRPFVTEAHQYSDNTQTNWNGILGGMEVRAEGAFVVDDVQVYPDLASASLRIELRVRNHDAKTRFARVEVQTHSRNHAGTVHAPPPSGTDFSIPQGASALGFIHSMGTGIKPWDEFSPTLYRVKIAVLAGSARVERTVDVGFREFRAKGTQIAVNGRTTFLRGKHDGCVFPITGHPPMKAEGWIEYFSKLRRYGINHVRCHTWVPPKAAFEAADRLGLYLQPEMPFWGAFDEKIREPMREEAERVLREYGNHPSFVMFTLGNELSGDRALMNGLIEHLRTLDPRHLYADGCNNVFSNPEFQPTNDFWVTARAKTPSTGGKSVPARGSFFQGDGRDGHVQWGPSSTREDLRAALEGIPAPVIGHEIGQYTVYPNFREISKYTGVVRARNLEQIRERLVARGQLDQAEAWFRASGALTATLYKEDIELALRTPGFGGFQLLDLQDFPGQGTALVGVLDAFMDSKGLITEEAWRQFCSPIVPLARFDRYTWTNGETYTADLELAHYGPARLEAAQVMWALVTSTGESVAHGSFASAPIEHGGLRPLGRVEASLEGVRTPHRLELEVTVAAGAERHVNRWPLWVYPEEGDTQPFAMDAAPAVAVVRQWSDAKARLREGGAVLFMAEGAEFGHSLSGAYATDFWCWPMFSNTPGTMGMLIAKEHAALADFPTSTHSERQWANIAHASRPVILTGVSPTLTPIVQVIDNFARNEVLGLIFESRVGEKGRLLVCAADLTALPDKPEARQLWTSLLRYVGSDAFAPSVQLEETALDRLWPAARP